METIQICFRCAESPYIRNYQFEGAVSHDTPFIIDVAVMMTAGPIKGEKFVPNVNYCNTSLG